MTSIFCTMRHNGGMAIKPIQIKLLHRLLNTGSTEQVVHALEKVHVADLAQLFYELTEDEIKRLVAALLELKKAGQALREIPEFMLADVLEIIDSDKLAGIIARLESDDAVYFLGKLSDERQRTVLDKIEDRKRAALIQLLMYSPGSAGAAMNANFLSVNIDETVEGAIKNLRNLADREGIFYVYVTDASRLVGVLPLRSLVLSDENRPVREFMTTELVTVLASEDQEVAAQRVSQYNLLAIPVVDDHQKLLGVITVDDVIDIFEEEATEDIYHMAGLSEDDRAFTPVQKKIKKRLPWMFINLATAFMAASVVGFFQGTISKLAILAAYMPVIAGMSGNVGTQSLVVITRSIALGEIEFSKASRAIINEMLNGILVGLIVGFVAGTIGYLVSGKAYLGLVIWLSMCSNMFIAGMAGTLVPLTLKRLKLDPAVASGIMVTTFTDTCGFFVFLGLATLFMDKF